MNGNNWSDLREFAGTDLLQSFVLSWEFGSECLSIDLDVCLLPDHPFYEKPRPSERICIRPARLEFPLCTSLRADTAGGEGRRPGDSDDPAAVAAALPHGRVESLIRVADGEYIMSGPFGRVHVTSERPLLRLKDGGV